MIIKNTAMSLYDIQQSISGKMTSKELHSCVAVMVVLKGSKDQGDKLEEWQHYEWLRLTKLMLIKVCTSLSCQVLLCAAIFNPNPKVVSNYILIQIRLLE